MSAVERAAATTGRMDVTPDVETLYRDGIVGRKGAFAREWAEAMREDMMTAFWSAIQRPGGAGALSSPRTSSASPSSRTPCA